MRRKYSLPEAVLKVTNIEYSRSLDLIPHASDSAYAADNMVTFDLIFFLHARRSLLSITWSIQILLT